MAAGAIGPQALHSENINHPAVFLMDGAHDGVWNMAFDEALVEFTAASRIAVLRLYGWSEPTISLGYFQRAEERLRLESLAGLRWVRRQTGGGAIVHDRELTYSIAMPDVAGRKGPAERLYASVHAEIVAHIRELGWDARKHDCASDRNSKGGSDSTRAADRARVCSDVTAGNSFLCFDRRSAMDIVVGGHKICGSAQRRSSGVVLQHGSILFGKSPAAPLLLGLMDLPKMRTHSESTLVMGEGWLSRAGLPDDFAGGEVTIDSFVQDFSRVLGDRLKQSLGSALGLEWRGAVDVAVIAERAEKLVDKYGSAEWNCRL